MAHANDTEGIIYQNLIDAGCDSETTQRCMELLRGGDAERMLPLLRAHRSALCEAVRRGQRQIDALDYLIFRISRHKDFSFSKSTHRH